MAKTAKSIGRAGGKARAAKLSPERRSEIASAAAQARWGTPKPTPRSKPAVHPQQPVVMAKDGYLRFKANALVRYMFDWLHGHAGAMGYPKLDAPPPTMNELAYYAKSGAALPNDRGKATGADLRQLNQLIGYSVSGCPGLSDAEWEAANKAATRIRLGHERKAKRRKARR
jgi:hypothetical protein